MKRYQRIEDLRKDLDYSQEEMAKLLFTSKTQYQRYENSEGNSFFDAMIQIANFHKVSLDYIAGRTNDKGGLHKNTEEEQEILNLYHQLSDKEKGNIKGRMELLIEQREELKAKKRETA